MTHELFVGRLGLVRSMHYTCPDIMPVLHSNIESSKSCEPTIPTPELTIWFLIRLRLCDYCDYVDLFVETFGVMKS